jgi:uncharacterized membrane protein YhhN
MTLRFIVGSLVVTLLASGVQFIGLWEQIYGDRRYGVIIGIIGLVIMVVNLIVMNYRSYMTICKQCFAALRTFISGSLILLIEVLGKFCKYRSLSRPGGNYPDVPYDELDNV